MHQEDHADIMLFAGLQIYHFVPAFRECMLKTRTDCEPGMYLKSI